MQQQLPQSVFWYERPGHLHIKLEPEEVRLSPMGHDAVILKKINGRSLRALVPTHSLGENHEYVPVNFAGKQGENIILHLPTSNEGRATWVIPESQLNAILINPHKELA